jgi:hypothetical protein
VSRSSGGTRSSWEQGERVRRSPHTPRSVRPTNQTRKRWVARDVNRPGEPVPSRFLALPYSRQDFFDVEGEALPALVDRHAADERVERERRELSSFVGPGNAIVGGEYLVDAFIP